jgi:ParB family chromosome partitioning protein
VEIATRKLADIITNSEYLRLNTDVETLKKSIEKIGLINPITINNNNELLAGARRFQAITDLAWEEIPVHIVNRDRLEQELISIDENRGTYKVFINRN